MRPLDAARALSILGALALGGCSARQEGGVSPDGGAACEGQSCEPSPCPAGRETILRGVVTAPGGEAPIRQALVYVPQGPVAPLPPEVGCEVCGTPLPTPPLARTVTDDLGRFVLRGAPAGAQTTLVVQKGRWRRTLRLPVTACADQTLPAEATRLPRSRGEGDLPQMAVAVGDFDAIECVLRSIGVDGEEFTAPAGAGAVHLYDNEIPGGGGAPGGVNVRELVGSLDRLLRYQLVFLNCADVTNSADLLRDPRVRQNLVDYVRRGGRLYVTDWSYDWVQQPEPLAPYLCFEDDLPCAVTTPHGFQAATGPGRAGPPTPFTAEVEQGTDSGRALAAWLAALPEPVTGGKVPITELSQDWVLLRQTALDPARFPSTTWLSGMVRGARRPMTVTFDYPPGAVCGRVLYSSYHTRGHAARLAFPRYCPGGKMLPQERILEFLLYELSSCVGPLG